MSFWFLWCSIGFLASLVALQAAYVVLYLRFLRSGVTSASEEMLFQDTPPNVAVILCLRGADPSLPACLESLMGMNGEFQLHLAFDDRDDPAYPLCQRLLADHADVHYHVNQDHGKNRSLKCSSIIATILDLDESIDIVALVDADAVVERDWLQTLIEPLSNPSIGATTGNRWFAPTAGGIGSTLRKVWNAAALPQMSLYQIPWGGSLAIRRDVIDQCELLHHWSVAFCEDTMLSGVLAEHGFRTERIPDLIIVNQESTSVRDAVFWIGRQLLTVKLYHRRWTWVLLHALLGAICLFVPPLIALYFLITFHFYNMAIVAFAWLMAQLINLVLVQLIEFGNRGAILRRNSRQTREPKGTAQRDFGPLCITPTGLIAFFLLQILYPFLAIGAAFQQRVRWRGVDYRIATKGRIEMVEYRRYAETLEPEKTGSDHSIH